MKRRIRNTTKEDIKIKTNVNELFSFALDRSDYHRFKIYVSPTPSIGSVFPRPKLEKLKKKYLILSSDIKFVLNSVNCNLAKLAISRYYDRIIRDKQVTHAEFHDLDTDSSICHNHNEKNCQIYSVLVTVAHCEENELPNENMNEKYKLSVEESTISLEAHESWGILRGLETLAQMIINVNVKGKQWLFIQEAVIKDNPKYVHRGLMIDTARHYITVDKILENLDMMEMNKMNVFHWHLTDDQSFPFKGLKHPELAVYGAFDNKSVYDKYDIKKVVEYARLRGIRVIPEIDLPGHVLSVSKSYSNLVFQCIDEDSSTSSMLNPTLLSSLDLMSDLYSDLIELFRDNYIHIGLDDVSIDCLKNQQVIKQYITNNEISYSVLIKKFISKIEQMIRIKDPQKTLVWWQEMSNNYLSALSNNSVAQLRKDSIKSIHKMKKFNVRLIYSTDFYLDRIVTGVNWLLFYRSELGKVLLKSILGAEATMWTEFQSMETITSNIWPTTCGLAELLWKGQDTDYVEIGSRIEEQRCRMLRRNFQVGVAGGPGECKYLSKHMPYLNISALDSFAEHIYSTPKVLIELMIFYFGLFVGFCFHRSRRYKLNILMGISIYSLIFIYF